MEPSPPQALDPHKPKRDWNALSALIAAFIGLLALLVSGYTAVIQRQQVRAQVWPHLETGISPSGRQVLLMNKGVGPASIRGLQLFVDDKPQHDWKHVFAALGLQSMKPPPYSTVNGVVLSAGDRLQQLAFLDKQDFDTFYPQYSRINLRICYCSALDECWVLDERIQDQDRQLQPISACPVRGPDEFIDN